MATTNKKCFVIMPFSKTTEKHTEGYWTTFFQDFIKTSVENLGFECSRSQAEPRSIIKGIVGDLFNSDLVLAVLTDLNPNVWYELGVRHSIHHGTIMMIEEGQKLPFDISQYGVIHYRRGNISEFRKELKKFISRIKSGNPDNPVRDHLLPVHLIPAEIEGVRSISEKDKFKPIFWNNMLANTSKTLDLLGHSLSKWLRTEHRPGFLNTLNRIAKQSAGHVRLLVMKPDASEDSQDVEKTLQTVFEQVKSKLSARESKRISVKWVDRQDIPYMFVRTDKVVVVSPYFVMTSSENSLLVELEPNTQYANRYVDDFETVFNDRAEDARWPLTTP